MSCIAAFDYLVEAVGKVLGLMDCRAGAGGRRGARPRGPGK